MKRVMLFCSMLLFFGIARARAVEPETAAAPSALKTAQEQISTLQGRIKDLSDQNAALASYSAKQHAQLDAMLKMPAIPPSATYKGSQLTTVREYEAEINNHCMAGQIEAECGALPPSADPHICLAAKLDQCKLEIATYYDLMGVKEAQ